jgi:hypothetical protein
LHEEDVVEENLVAGPVSLEARLERDGWDGSSYHHIDILADAALGVRLDNLFDRCARVQFLTGCHGGDLGDDAMNFASSVCAMCC